MNAKVDVGSDGKGFANPKDKARARRIARHRLKGLENGARTAHDDTTDDSAG